MADFKLGIFQIIGLIGVLATRLTSAAADGRITVKEAFDIVKDICEYLGIDFDTDGFDIPGCEDGSCETG